MNIRIGCAGWTIPKGHTGRFPSRGTHLERYASVFDAVEINSSFYRPHRTETYQRWASSVPEGFRFSVKVPRQITHLARLKDASLFLPFLKQVSGLGGKLGPLLVQIPASLGFDVSVARHFLRGLRENFGGAVVLEPRHSSWLSPEAERLMREFQVARVAADPAIAPAAALPGAWEGLSYYRLHGSPQIYRSSYSKHYLDNLAARLMQSAPTAGEIWCIFDNTAQGAATANALYLLEALGQ